MPRPAFFAHLAGALLAALPCIALAGPCGDDLGGRRVPCRCGDTVVVDARLRSGDPIVSERCPIDGLTIRADPLAESITLDLAGLTIEGSGAGVGIRVEFGGADGAHLVGGPAGAHGLVRSFGIGVLAASRRALARATRIAVRDNRYEGMRIVGAGVILEDVVASGNGADGIYLRGTGGRLVGVESVSNKENGIRVFSNEAVVAARAAGNGRSGIVLDGFRNDASRAQAHQNGRHGIVIRGRATVPTASAVRGNGGDAVRVNGRRVGL